MAEKKTRKKRSTKEKEPAPITLEAVEELPLSMKPRMRRFVYVRNQDDSGVSGIGIKIEGIEFSNGKVCITWYTHMNSVTTFDSMKAFLSVHGHDGNGQVLWLDEDPNEELAKPSEG